MTPTPAAREIAANALRAYWQARDMGTPEWYWGMSGHSAVAFMAQGIADGLPFHAAAREATRFGEELVAGRARA